MLLVAVVVAPAARADGDPASDYLLTQPTFVSPNARISSSDQARLAALVTSSRRHGYPIRVAVIQSRYDLGSVTALDHKPRLYARFLSEELRFIYRKRLLVVMPNGYGIARDGKPAPAEQVLLDKLNPAESLDGSALVAAAIRAVDALMAHAGVPVPDSHTDGATTAHVGGLVVAAAVLLGLVTSGLAVIRRRRSVG